ncbi:C45 family autoproteolytic acyltransferase/hydolase [Amycolatopsis suaedae]|uniref:Acyl-coenzyme A--6-aminopenicillanic-acid-acyltransferase form n=1 Tax=Amycolatopsis suaedae TaxID=2510978 RepID=A0A4Q7J3D4_9PSEU|nr:C45 family peptidase [Amycolatopsis suaedae]RZQ60833.1 acyl-coenzyme A--6-aminopenicillanic-acid-acyltransferase form [Amycolatopsis suaedae]
MSIPTIEISGDPHTRGTQYGEQTREAVATAIGYYTESLGKATGLTWAQIRDKARRWLEPAREFAPELVEEMDGIAAGAGVHPGDILVLNVRGEASYDPTFRDVPDGCTSFAMTTASGDGHVYCGQNWDWRDGVRDTVVLLRIVQPPKPTVVMHVEAGQVGRQGANSAGIGLNANGLGGRFDATMGVPQTLIRRKALDCASLSDALDVLVRTRGHIASNALLTHRDRFAIDVETTPGACGWMYPDDGLLVHGNHFQAFVPPQLAAEHRPFSPDSLIRVPRATEGLRRCADATDPAEVRKRIRTALSDHLGYPDSLCAHPDPAREPVRRWATLLSSCVDLTAGEYRVTPGNPCANEYQLAPWNLYDGPGEVRP